MNESVFKSVLPRKSLFKNVLQINKTRAVEQCQEELYCLAFSTKFLFLDYI